MSKKESQVESSAEELSGLTLKGLEEKTLELDRQRDALEAEYVKRLQHFIDQQEINGDVVETSCYYFNRDPEDFRMSFDIKPRTRVDGEPFTKVASERDSQKWQGEHHEWAIYIEEQFQEFGEVHNCSPGNDHITGYHVSLEINPEEIMSDETPDDDVELYGKDAANVVG